MLAGGVLRRPCGGQTEGTDSESVTHFRRIAAGYTPWAERGQQDAWTYCCLALKEEYQNVAGEFSPVLMKKKKMHFCITYFLQFNNFPIDSETKT